MQEQLDVMIGALLHDIGKIIQRAGGYSGNHSQIGFDYLKQTSPEIVKRPEIKQSILYHHAQQLKNANVSSNSIAYIVYEADNIAAGVDRRQNQAEESAQQFNKATPLESVFNLINTQSPHLEKQGFNLYALRDKGRDNIPKKLDGITATSAQYAELVEIISRNLPNIPLSLTGVNALLKLLETVGVYVPSSTATKEVADISLYDHVKLTAAIAVCMFQYMQQQNITDYKQACFNSTTMREENCYLLVSGDLSGIQSFIYTVSSKGALKSLRGRSFYLELLVEHIIDELLEKLQLSRANILYSGGGHFYLILPNTHEAKQAINVTKETVNHWFLETFGTKLYLALGFTECTANQLANGLNQTSEDNLLGEAFQQVGAIISKQKIQRYSKENIQALCNPDSNYNRIADSERECAICGTSTNHLSAWKYDEASDTQVCDQCQALYQFGESIVMYSEDYQRINEKKIPVIALSENKPVSETGIEVPSESDCKKYLNVQTLAQAEQHLKNGEVSRIYSINRLMVGTGYATNLWAGTYNKKPKNQQGLIEFSELANNSHGIKRLAVLRADVDNLGATFISGLKQKNSQNPYQYMTLSRSATLSRELSLFFKHHINGICEERILSNKAFTFNNNQPHNNITIVYSGGDDVFAVGAWNDVMTFAINLRETFKQYVGNHITLSAGIGMFHAQYPIVQMADLTGQLEEKAKSMPGKDAVALFGIDQQADSESNEHVYRWDEFIDGVCHEKYMKLNEWFSFSENEAQQSSKLLLSKSCQYRLMQLIRSSNNDNSINLARMAYLLARLEPSKHANPKQIERYHDMRNQLYQWLCDKEQRNQLLTALNMIIYYTRNEKEE